LPPGFIHPHKIAVGCEPNIAGRLDRSGVQSCYLGNIEASSVAVRAWNIWWEAPFEVHLPCERECYHRVDEAESGRPESTNWFDPSQINELWGSNGLYDLYRLVDRIR